ncbi:11867_t:CDS:2, partial [Gigaspora margarita]
AINTEKEMPCLNILEAIRFITEAWDSVTQEQLLIAGKNPKSAMTANDYIQIDDSLEIEEVILDEAAILEEILPQFNSDSSSDKSVIEIEKISHSVTLEQCRLLMQYVEQQDPIKFVEGQDLPQLRSLLK